jgi:hypothetical protein
METTKKKLEKLNQHKVQPKKKLVDMIEFTKSEKHCRSYKYRSEPKRFGRRWLPTESGFEFRQLSL